MNLLPITFRRLWIPQTQVAAAMLLCLVASLLALSGTSPARAAEPTGPEIGSQWHATWASETDTTRAKALDAFEAKQVRWVRIDVGWAMVQPNRGSFDTKWAVPFIERQIDAARAHGAKVMLTFWQTPGWANGGRSLSTPPTNPQDYAKALAWLIDRWQGKVNAWQVWNEPNLDDFFAGEDPVKYTQLLKAAYVAGKAADPSANIVFGGTMYVDTAWITRAYAAGAKGYFDAMAVHPYQGDAEAPPESPDTGDPWNMMHVDALVSLMRSRGDGNLPIYFTEFGWSVHSDTASTPPWQRGVTEAQQADYLKRSVALVGSRWPQVKAMFWYNSRDKDTGQAHQDGFGLMRRDFSPRPVMNAIAALQPSSAARASTQVQLRASADASVDSASPTTNRGADWALSSDGNPEQRTLLKFDLPAPPAGKKLSSVQLGLSTTGSGSSGSGNAHQVSLLDDSTWTEARVNYDNRPSRTKVVGTLPAGSRPDQRYSITLDPSLLAGSGARPVSLVVWSLGEDGVQFVADESGDAGGRPTLRLTYN